MNEFSNTTALCSIVDKQLQLEQKLDRIEKLINEIKVLVSQTKSNSAPTKITVIGNRPQKTLKIKGIDSDADCAL